MLFSVNRFFRYLRAAFFVRERIPFLGAVPVNVLVVASVVVLGLGHPAFWLLGLGAEIAFLWSMIGSRRFRALVDARIRLADSETKEDERQTLIHQLIPPSRARHDALRAKFEQVADYYRQFAGGDVIAEENLTNLKALEIVYLKLIIARQHLSSPDSETEVLRLRIAELKADIADDPVGTRRSIKESKAATLELLQKRLTVFAKRHESLEEIDSDLSRIEAQFDLAADSAAIRAKPVEARLDLDLASRMMDVSEFLDFGYRDFESAPEEPPARAELEG